MSLINDMAPFRLSAITIMEHPVLGNLHIDFCRNDGFLSDVYTSVIIGANGIGKSHLLRSLAEVFCCLESLYNGKEPVVPRYYFHIAYSSHRERMEFANFRGINHVSNVGRRYNQFVFRRQGAEVEVRDIIMPKRVIASATTITDKYVAKSTEIYRYKGLRNENNPSYSGTRTMVRKTVDSLLGSLDSKFGFRDELCELLTHLGMQPRLELSYNLRYKHVFVREDMTGFELQHIFEHQDQFFEKRKTKLWGSFNFEKMRDEDIHKLDVLAAFYARLAHRGYDDGRQLLRYDLLDECGRVSEDREALKIMSQLDLLSYPSLRVYKNEGNFVFEQSSSGESSLLCQMVSIMSDLEPNSLVLIDEPESSSHPNWQINYIGWLKRIFRRYNNCHFIISTHSHFMLTDLEPQTSDIVALEKKDGVIRDVSEGVNTFNWSVDDILYRVFGVRNTRNYVFEAKVIDLYKLVENRGDNLKVKELMEELLRYKLNDDDPLMKLLETAKKYVESD